MLVSKKNASQLIFCEYKTLLNQIEDFLEEDNFLEYAFGLHFLHEKLFDENFMRIVAFKKMLHSLVTISVNIKDFSHLQAKYNDRINILKLKLENRLKLEMEQSNTWNSLVCEKNFVQNSDINIHLENNSTCCEIKEIKINKVTARENPNIENNSFIGLVSHEFESTEKFNEKLKDELVELAEELKNSALRFGEIMNKEKEVSFF